MIISVGRGFQWLVILMFLASCASPIILTNRGKLVQILDSKVNIDDYQNLGEIECSLGWNGRSPETNITACMNDLRNKASQLKASYVLILSKRTGLNNDFFARNSVEMKAVALSPK